MLSPPRMKRWCGAKNRLAIYMNFLSLLCVSVYVTDLLYGSTSPHGQLDASSACFLRGYKALNRPISEWTDKYSKKGWDRIKIDLYLPIKATFADRKKVINKIFYQCMFFYMCISWYLPVCLYYLFSVSLCLFSFLVFILVFECVCACMF